MTSTTSRRAVIFHGYAASPRDHWFEWLAERLTDAGIPTRVPALPNSSAPSRDQWAATVARELGTPGEETVVVAHSLGCLAVLRHLASLTGPWQVGTLVLVSGFVDTLPALPALDDFIGDGVDLAGIREHIGSLTIVRSDDDTHVPVELTDRLARLLGTSAAVVPGAGHFLAADGVTTLPHALRAVL
ncbi:MULTISPECIES: RBBP9/YdeN family alpha/beta hydrolase [unclassified Dietzia]|uniref:RBBP9/YdeN family alpha/beta hydrolase n=1 Tax=unclassified Dietzia TaxID=2617939 RepID=UPI0015FBA978|nr:MULTISPECIES: alpha/beta hydrolase [unclassified Dietzia]MBB1024569.1 serine hydrolase family protein [Dietzia sp. DQ12-76]MBB1028069.1 serine hydrolase family protein [Dietzia sp. DQ11-38-2]